MAASLTVKEVVRQLRSKWDADPVTTEQTLAQAEQGLRVLLPADYKAVVLELGTGETVADGPHLYLWKVDELKQLNDGYEVAQWLPSIVFFGTDGGPTFFGFDYRSQPLNPSVIGVPAGDFDWPSVEELGRNMLDFMANYLQLTLPNSD
jgi:hypothetical protein